MSENTHTLSTPSAFRAGKYVNLLSCLVFPSRGEIVYESDGGEIYGSKRRELMKGGGKWLI